MQTTWRNAERCSDLVEWVTLYCEKCQAETKHNLTWERKKQLSVNHTVMPHAHAAAPTGNTPNVGEDMNGFLGLATYELFIFHMHHMITL